MDKELTHGLMEKNTLENGKIIQGMDKERRQGKMEENKMENLKKN